MKIQIGLKIYIWNDFVLIPVYTALKICQKYYMWDKTKYCIFYSVSLKIYLMTVMLVDVYMFVFNLIADESSAQLLRNHKEMTKFYLEMYLNVNKINSSVSELMDTVLTMQKDLEKKISWFSHILGSSGKIFCLKLKVRWLSYEGSNYTIGIMNCYSFTDLYYNVQWNFPHTAYWILIII